MRDLFNAIRDSIDNTERLIKICPDDHEIKSLLSTLHHDLLKANTGLLFRKQVEKRFENSDYLTNLDLVKAIHGDR